MKRMSCLFFLGFFLVFTVLPVAADAGGDGVEIDELIDTLKLPLTEETDRIARGILEKRGVCRYLSDLGRRKNLGESWVEQQPEWERAQAMAQKEIREGLLEPLGQYAQTSLLKRIAAQQFSAPQIEQLKAFARSDAGQAYLRRQDPLIAVRIMASVSVPPECVTDADYAEVRAWHERVEEALSRNGRNESSGEAADAAPAGYPASALGSYLAHYLDYYNAYASRWQRMKPRFDARMENILAEWKRN